MRHVFYKIIEKDENTNHKWAKYQLTGQTRARHIRCRILESYLEKLRTAYPDLEIDYYQSNIEGEMIDKIHEVGFEYAGIILNAGAYTHTSIALQDAIRAVTAPVVEVHISNVHKREEFRHKSMISCACLGVICGFGLDSYRLAVEALLHCRKDSIK